MAERRPMFELHIRPLFRLLDRQHMLLEKRPGPLGLRCRQDAIRPNPAKGERHRRYDDAH